MEYGIDVEEALDLLRKVNDELMRGGVSDETAREVQYMVKDMDAPGIGTANRLWREWNNPPSIDTKRVEIGRPERKQVDKPMVVSR